jgi:hypothetical protein
MLLSEKRVWKVVTGEHPRPKSIEQTESELADNAAKLTESGRKKI